MSFWKLLNGAFVFFLTGMLLPLCACSDADEPGYYRLPLTDNPVSLDPAKFTDVDSEGVARRIFNGLVGFDENLHPAPDLARAWEMSPDGLTYTFHLRKGVQFHNGREMTAEDVRYSLERLLRGETGSRRPWVAEPIAGAPALREGKAESLSGIEVPDPYTVRIRLREPFAPFLHHLAMAYAAIVPREEVEKTGSPFGRRPVGTGPFRFVSWKDNDAIVLKRNEDYFKGPAKLAGMKFRIIKESLVAYQEYQAGNLEHCAVPEGYLDKVRNGPRKDELRSTKTLSTYYLGIMMNHDPCGKNVHLRSALNYAVDREFLCRKVLGGSHTPARGLFPPGLPGYNPNLRGYTYDPDRARQELEAAGCGADQSPLEFTLYYTAPSPGPQVVQAIRKDFERIGVRLKLRALDFGALMDATNKSEPDLFRLSWIADFPDPCNFLSLFQRSRHGSAGNRVRYSNRELDALLDEARRETDDARRLQLQREAEQTIVDDAPWVFLSHKHTHLLVKPYVRGFKLGPMDVGTSVNQVDFHAVSIEPGPQE